MGLLTSFYVENQEYDWDDYCVIVDLDKNKLIFITDYTSYPKNFPKEIKDVLNTRKENKELFNSFYKILRAKRTKLGKK